MLLGGISKVVARVSSVETEGPKLDVSVLGRRRKPPESMMKWTPPKVVVMSSLDSEGVGCDGLRCERAPSVDGQQDHHFKKQGKSKGKNKKSGKKAATPPVKPKSGPKPDAECYYYKEKGHWKRNCSKYLAGRAALSRRRKKSSAVPEDVPVPPTPATEEANDNDHETSNEIATEPRRSTRERATPDWYDPCLNVMIVDNNDEDPATYQSDPGMEHWTAVKNILKYLKRTKDMFLCYGGDQELVVTSYTDASWNTDPDDSKSQSGYVFILNGAAVSWASSKQCTVAKSSTESEYIAASEAVWMKRFIVELGVVPSALDPLVIYCDNMGAIANAQEPRSHKRLKHIKLRYHSIREYIEDGEVKICKVHTDLNVADPLTKALPRAKHDQHQNAMGVRREVVDSSSQIWHRNVFFLDLMELRRSKPKVWRRREMRISINKAGSGGSGGHRCSSKLLLLPRRGGDREEFLLAVFAWSSDLQQGSSSASSRRFSTAPLSPYSMAERQPLHRRTTTAPMSPYSMAEGRPLHPCAAATGRPQGSSNLRKPLFSEDLSFGGVGSHLCVPSGLVPGGAEVDSDKICRGCNKKKLMKDIKCQVCLEDEDEVSPQVTSRHQYDEE
ncbi:hypothetical protein QYE76_056776 [Lolium multiflorum]|uniref:Retrotransposon protein, putative, Ty1-copia subclass n=1 Tax=Lolium multiflorum TaxID=4521 RepID=A0AAD8WN76_LOLMU|nr:hypothetical protein QYE76_056776 [Lolium multiflorum]